MTLRHAVAAMAVIVVGAATTACGVPTQDTASFEDDAEVPFGLLDATTTTRPTADAPSGTGARELCLLREDMLAITNRSVATGLPADLTLTDLVTLLATGPTDTELADGLSTAVPEDPLADQVTVAGGVANVDLAGHFADTEGHRQLLGIAQIVCTLTSAPGVGQVTFTLDGQPVEVPRGDGSTTSNPVSREDYRQLGVT